MTMFKRKPRVVKGLKVEEVSVVEAGANPLSKVVLLKRDADRELKTKTDHAVACLAKSVQSIVNDSGANKNEMLGRSFAQFLQHIGKLTKTKIPLEAVVGLNEIFKNDNERSEPDLSDTDAGMPDRRGRRRREDAHARLDAAMASDIDRDHADDEGESESDTGGESTDQLERAERGMETKMKSYNQMMRDVIKRYGLIPFCKSVAQGDVSVSEHDLTKLIEEAAAREKTTFSKLFEKPEIWKAVQAARDANWLGGTTTLSKAEGMPGRATLTPRITGGRAARAVDNPKSALDELQALVNQQRAANPALSESQAWLAVYTHPDNQALAARERAENRPVATAG